jgi:hypothetical protein
VSAAALALSLGLAIPFGPFPTAAAPVSADAIPREPLRDRGRSLDHPLDLAFEVYRLTLTTFDGPRCDHHPVCSVYALRAVRRDGFLGAFLAVDRTWRGSRSSALRRLPVVWIGEQVRFEDPLSESDFWFQSPVGP